MRYRWAAPVAADDTQLYEVSPVAVCADTDQVFAGLDTLTSPKCDIVVNAEGSLRFDFGVETPGWLEFESADFTGDVEMSISEYNEPGVVNPEAEHPIKTAAPERVGNVFRLVLNKEGYEGVRFGWIHVRRHERVWHISAVRVVAHVKPTNYNGEFACSDAMLNRIWYVGAYSVKANLEKDHFSPILMDRSDRYAWAGDCFPAQAAALVAFGNWDFIKLNLQRTVDASFDIDSYELYWILSLIDYIDYSGDVGAFAEFEAACIRKIETAIGIFDDPPIGFYGWDERLGAGFEDPRRDETQAAYRMLVIRACRALSDLLHKLPHYESLADRFEGIADAKRDAVRANLRWLDELGIHAASDAVLAGCVEESEYLELVARLFGARASRLSFSVFNQFFIIDAMAKLGQHDDALVTVKDNWGAQLDYGATIFAEAFRHEWAEILGPNDPIPNSQAGWTSLGHAWGGGVTSWLSREIAGIRPTSPGFVTLDVLPKPGASLTRIKASVPTPRGPASMDLDIEMGTLNVSIPPGSVARIGVPKSASGVHVLEFDGTTWGGPALEGETDSLSYEDDDFVYIGGVRAGKHSIRMEYDQPRAAATIPAPFAYPLDEPAEDSNSGGDWGGKYGRDGYTLFSYLSPDEDLSRVPDYVLSVTPGARENRWGGWGNCTRSTPVVGTSARTALAPDMSNSVPRNIGVLHSNTPSFLGMTMTLDVDVVPETRYLMSLYFLDWDLSGRRLTVDLFDLATREPLSRTRLVDRFTTGTYLSYRCDRSVRIRISHVRGENAVLQGIFFDPAS